MTTFLCFYTKAWRWKLNQDPIHGNSFSCSEAEFKRFLLYWVTLTLRVHNLLICCQAWINCIQSNASVRTKTVIWHQAEPKTPSKYWCVLWKPHGVTTYFMQLAQFKWNLTNLLCSVEFTWQTSLYWQPSDQNMQRSDATEFINQIINRKK